MEESIIDAAYSTRFKSHAASATRAHVESNIPPVAVIGGGIAGLTAAAFLRLNGIPVTLFEAGNAVSGLAASHTDTDGFTYDFGAHFITNRLADAVGVSSQCRVVKYYGESIWYRGRTYGYPFGLMCVPSFALSGLRAVMCGLASRDKPRTALDVFRKRYGVAFTTEIAAPLLESWSGVPAFQLAASVADKLKNGIFHTAYLRACSKLKGVAVACGYCQEMPESPAVWHVYPIGGVSLICQRLSESLSECIELEAPVERIYVENERAVGIRVKGRDLSCSAVINTAPLTSLSKLISGTDTLAGLSQFRYRPMIFVNLRFAKRGILSNTVLWTLSKDLPFFRLTETPLSMPWLAPEGKTLITADISCDLGDRLWAMEDEALGDLCIGALKRIVGNVGTSYLGCRVLRTPIAYPVYLESYETERQRFAASTGISALCSIGRNGEFRHMLMEDIYWRTRKKMRELVDVLQNGEMTNSKVTEYDSG